MKDLESKLLCPQVLQHEFIMLKMLSTIKVNGEMHVNKSKKLNHVTVSDPRVYIWVRGGPTSECHLECHLVEYVLFYMVIMEHVMKKQNGISPE